MNIYIVAILTILLLSGCATTGHIDSGDNQGNKPWKAGAIVPDNSPEEEVLAVVNGKEITIAEYNRKLSGLSAYERARYRSEEGHKEFLNSLILQRIMVEKAKEIGLDKDEEVQKKIEALMQDTTARVLAEALVKREVLDKVVVTDKEAKAYYDEHKNEFVEKERAKIRQITVATEEDAQRIRQELENGADFVELAKENSIDPHAANKSGDPGYIERGRMSAELDKVIFNLEVGGISDPVKTKLGYHIIKLEEKKEASTREFYEVSDEIKEKLLFDKQQKEYKEWLHQLEGNAKIEIKTSFGGDSAGSS